MKNSIKIFLFLFGALLFTSCEDPIDIELDQGESQLVVDAFINNLSDKQIIKLLNTVQFPNALPALIEEIGKYIGKRNANFLVAACWEANYECSKFIKAIAVIATHANAHELIECFSIIENIIIHPALEDVLFSLKKLDEAIEISTDEVQRNLLISCRDLIAELQ